MTDPSSSPPPMPPLRPCDHLRGSPDYAVTVMAYGDYQCPRSSQAYATVNDVQKSHSQQLCLVYRHFPQTPPQTTAWKAAEAAEVASEQGKFWEMHDLLYQTSKNLGDDKLVECAVEAGLDVPQFLKGLANHTCTEKVQADVESGVENGVTEVPTFFIHLRHQGTQNLEKLLHQVMAAIESLPPETNFGNDVSDLT